MKTLLIPGALLAGLLLFSFSPGNQAITLEKALQEKKISVVIEPTGSYSGNSINLKLRNLSNTSLRISLPAGTTFVPDNTGEQTLITTQEEVFALGRNQESLFNLNAFCTEAHDACPSTNSTFKIARSSNKTLLGLLSFMDSLKLNQNSLIQQSIWCVTDSESVACISGPDRNQSKAVRQYICKATGQKDTWYTLDNEISVGSDRQIIRTPQVITGEVEYTSTERTELQGVVKDANGNIIVTNPNKTVCPPGHVKFDFRLRVEGWAAGNYSVVYTNNGKEVINKPFTI